MAKVKVEMPEEFLRKLSLLGSKTDEIAGRVLEAGGEVVLAKVRSNLSSVIGSGTKYDSRSTGELERFITAAISYAESYQHIAAGYYQEHPMPPTTEQAVIMLSSHFYESRDGSTGGFFADNVQAGQQVWNTVNLLLRLDREWKV